MAFFERVCPALFACCVALSATAGGAAATPDTPVACLGAATCASGQEVTGTILIKKKLTRPSVTPSISMYQRGTAVELGKDSADSNSNANDPLSFERSRVVIYLEGPGLAAAGPARPAAASMQQINRRFTPDLLVVPAGASVAFPNGDPIFHNIFSLSKPKEFDLGSYSKGESRSVTFAKPGVVYVYCHLHPNMEATIVVTPNRWYARSDGAGQYRIPNVPPGEYTVVAWHKAAGFFRKSIVIEPGHNATADFFIPIDDTTPQKAQMNMKGDSMTGMASR